MASFGERLRAARKERGLSGPELAEQIGVSAQVVSEWERGRYMPGADKLPVLASGRALFRKWKPRGKKVLLEPLNPDWEPESMLLAGLDVRGVMTEHTRPRRG